MESNQEYSRMRKAAQWIFLAVIVAVASIFALTLVTGRFLPNIYPPFFGWWIFVPLFIFGFFFFFRWWGWGYWWGSKRYYYDYEPALETLRQRFARGEISREQYEQMKKDLV